MGKICNAHPRHFPEIWHIISSSGQLARKGYVACLTEVFTARQFELGGGEEDGSRPCLWAEQNWLPIEGKDGSKR